MLRFGAPVAALQLLAELAGNSDYLVVGHKLGSEALGFYSIAYRLPELLLSNVYWIFSSVAFPIFSKARTAGGAAFRGSMLKALRLITMFGFPVGVGLALVWFSATPYWCCSASRRELDPSQHPDGLNLVGDRHRLGRLRQR